MSDHSDLKQFLKNLDSMLDTVRSIIDNAKCQIRVEQELNEHAQAIPEEKVSGPTESDAPFVVAGQGGPKPHVQGTPREIGRSTKETEKVLLKGGRMETPHGRS